jgi:phage terminase large subunit-like protein
MNQGVNAQTAWLPSGAWDSLEYAEPISDDTPIVIFGDGSFSGDSTFLVACSVEEVPRIWKIAAWEKQTTDTDNWRVDIADVENTLIEACKRWNVVEVPFDPFRWQRSMQSLAEMGLPIVEYPTSSPARMVPSTAKFYDAVMAGTIRHDHDPQLARHLDNCVIKTDRLGPRITKEHRSSKRKIDGAVCAVGAFDRATSYRREPAPPSVQFY